MIFCMLPDTIQKISEITSNVHSHFSNQSFEASFFPSLSMFLFTDRLQPEPQAYPAAGNELSPLRSKPGKITSFPTNKPFEMGK